jgi:superfamily II DNA or RNA helicase
MALSLRGYQKDAVTALGSWLAGGERELLLESPVGSGKTTTIKALAARLLASGSVRLVVVLVPQILLRGQWKAAGAWKIGRSTFTLPEAIETERVADLTPAFWRTAVGVVVLTRQALTSIGGMKVLKNLARILGDVLVVADEGHHCHDANESGKMLALLRDKGAATILVSATPFATGGPVGGPNCKAYRFPEYEYVTSFAKGDLAQPPAEFALDRVFVGTPVSDAEATIDRSGQKGRKVEPEEDRSAEMIKALAKRWKADGFPRAVFNVPRQSWAEPLAEALRKVKPRANLLDLVGDDIDDDAKDRLAQDSKAARWADVKIAAVLSCARMDEGIDWVPCSHIYNVGIPASPTLILQRWGRAARAKRKIEGYPAKWAEARTLVFFTPPGTGEGDSWKAQLSTAWLLGGFLADYNVAREWTQERAARGIVERLPVPGVTPEIRDLIGRLAERIQRTGCKMTASDARLWLVCQGCSAEVTEAVIKRTQMLSKEARDLMTTCGLQIKPQLRAEAERLIEEMPLLSAPALGHAVTFTALGVKEIGENMAARHGVWANMTLPDLQAFVRSEAAKINYRPTSKSGGMWSAVASVLLHRGSSLADTLGRAVRSFDQSARDIKAFLVRTGRCPSSVAVDAEERNLAGAWASIRTRKPSLCAKYDFPLYADRSVAMVRRHGKAQFSTFAECLVDWARSGAATRAPIRKAIRAAQASDKAKHSRGLFGAVDLCQVNSLVRASYELGTDCWALTLEGATAPDPRPWADILVSGDHKRIVKVERTHFLDWAKPGKDGKPVRRVFKMPA